MIRKWLRFRQTPPSRQTPRARPQLEILEARVIPVVDFQIVSLGITNPSVFNHEVQTGDDHGGITTSPVSVFVTGEVSTGRFGLANLSQASIVPGGVFNGLIGDLATRTSYVLGSNATTKIPRISGQTATHLLEMDDFTGALSGRAIALSQSIALTGGTGFYSGYGRVVIHPDNGNVFEIALPSGQVTDRGMLTTSPRMTSENDSCHWGVAEHVGGEVFLVHTANQTTITRTRVSDGQISTVSTFTNLGQIASLTVSVANSRWFFHNEDSSQATQFGGGGETVGSVDATFTVGASTIAPPVVTSPTTAATTPNTVFNITGTSAADSSVFVYRDFNNNGMIDGADAIVAVQRLSGGATNFNIPTPLDAGPNNPNNFLVTAADANGESAPTDVPGPITQDTIGPIGVIGTNEGQSDPTAVTPILFKVVFTEPVMDFAANDVNLSGTAGATTALVNQSGAMDGTTFTVAVSGMTQNGSVMMTITPGSVTDLAGNTTDLIVLLNNRVMFDQSAPPPGGMVAAPAASGDFNGDNRADIVVVTGVGRIRRVKVIDGLTGRVLFRSRRFRIPPGGFLRARTIDVNGDGHGDLVINRLQGEKRRIQVFDGTTGAPLLNVVV